MSDPTSHVLRSYARHDLTPRVLEALQNAFPDRTGTVGVDDLAAVDEFHIRGRESTVELAELAGIETGSRVLDVGCGLGGSARYLATHFDAEVVGVDLTPGYVSLARRLSRITGCDDRTTFHRGSALELPVEDDSFDLVWLEHVQVNVPKKNRLVGELARVLRSGGSLAFHEIFSGNDEKPHFPVPWAEDPEASFLVEAGEFRDRLAGSGLEEEAWRDVSEASLLWFEAVSERLAEGEHPPLGLHLLMGETAPAKLGNVGRSLAEGRIRVVQGVFSA